MMTYEEELKMRRNALLEASSARVLLDDGAATLQLRKRSAEDGEGCYPRQYLVLGAQDVKLLLGAVKAVFAEEWADFLTCGNVGVLEYVPTGELSLADVPPQVTSKEADLYGEKGPPPEGEKKIRFREWL